MARILVTGGAGYIGSVLVPMLLEADNKVIVVDNFMYGQTPLLDSRYYQKLTIIRGDARDEKLMAELVKNADVIIPLACIVGERACNNDKTAAETTNLRAILMLLQVRRTEQPTIFPNTNSGYGIGQDGIYCDENSPLNPISYYGQLKVSAEKAVLASGNAVVLRLATVFGISPRMRLDLLVNDFTYEALKRGYIVLSEGHFKRNYIHVRDAARAFMHCMENFETMKGQVYNLGMSDANLSKRELCEEIKKQIPELRIIEDDVMKDPDKRNYIVSNEKIEKTGFKPNVSIQEGIAEIIRAYPILIKHPFSNI